MKFNAPITGPASQFRFEALGAVQEILSSLPREAARAMEEAYPALQDYRIAGEACWQGERSPSPREWRSALADIARMHPDWPLQRLALLGMGPLHARILIVLAMVEEDPGLSLLFEPDPGALTQGGLIARLRSFAGLDAPETVRVALGDLTLSALVEVDPATVPRAERRYRISDVLAEILLGSMPRQPGLNFRPVATLPRHDDWIAPRGDAPTPADAANALSRGGSVTVVRSAARNGRKTFAAMAARAAGKALLECDPAVLSDDRRHRSALATATLTGAAMLVEIESLPSETVRLPTQLGETAAPSIVICGLQGAVETAGPARMRSFCLPMPSSDARTQHWRKTDCGNFAERLGNDWILTSGNIHRAAEVAAGAIRGDADAITARREIRLALRDLRDARIEALASPIDGDRAPFCMVLDAEAEDELDCLVARCRHREALCEPGGMAGVRALLSGPSGVGKTLAARHVAWRLGRDLFRIDLAATVNKYIGETEKALERALAAAEELDVVLLLDEGDALMAKRTDVATANDRYANLETNFLLQRIENFGGILLVTSNDPGRIDPAFARRMDSSITLRAPDQVRREKILSTHLGEDTHISPGLMSDIACRCDLTGGQIRNVSIHARLLSLERGNIVGDGELRAAIEREYRKLGTPCPLRGGSRPLAAVV